MKKLAIIALLATATMAASATDIGLRVSRSGGHEPNNAGITATGVTLGTKLGAFGAELAYDRAMVGATSVSEYSLTGSYPVATGYGTTFAAKVGGSFIDPTVGVNGYALTVGVGASLPITKQVSLVADYAYKIGQQRVTEYSGNTVSIGAKYSF